MGNAIKSACMWLWAVCTAPILWVSQILTEPDGNGGKASFSRVVGIYVTWKIIELIQTAEPAQRALAVPEVLWNMFMILVGYQLLSKALNSMSPAVMDIARSMLLKVQNGGKKDEKPEGS